jgi:hypothetical protein
LVVYIYTRQFKAAIVIFFMRSGDARKPRVTRTLRDDLLFIAIFLSVVLFMRVQDAPNECLKYKQRSAKAHHPKVRFGE